MRCVTIPKYTVQYSDNKSFPDHFLRIKCGYVSQNAIDVRKYNN
jgi:hypothetical protein